MLDKFSSLVDKLVYISTLSEIKNINEKQDDFSLNTMLYRKIICTESGKHTVSSIANLLSVATTAVTQKVNELERKGAVERRQCENDKRISYLYGVEKHCPCKDALSKRDTYVFSELEKTHTKEELDKFLEIFEQMNSLYVDFDKEN